MFNASFHPIMDATVYGLSELYGFTWFCQVLELIDGRLVEPDDAKEYLLFGSYDEVLHEDRSVEPVLVVVATDAEFPPF